MEPKLCRQSDNVWRALKTILELEPLTVYYLRMNQIATANNKWLTIILDCLAFANNESIATASIRNDICITEVRKRLVKALGKHATAALQGWLVTHTTLLASLIERLGPNTWPCIGLNHQPKQLDYNSDS
jgi:hypothetical protein